MKTNYFLLSISIFSTVLLFLVTIFCVFLVLMTRDLVTSVEIKNKDIQDMRDYIDKLKLECTCD
jgi:hypothetical protein